jgi:hypothetical protein
LKTDETADEEKAIDFMSEAENGGVTKDGYIVLRRNKRMNFAQGENSLAKKLELEKIQTLSSHKDLPDNFLITYMTGEYDISDWRYRFDKTQSDAYVKIKNI